MEQLRGKRGFISKKNALARSKRYLFGNVKDGVTFQPHIKTDSPSDTPPVDTISDSVFFDDDSDKCGNATIDDKLKWKDGRRIVELGHMADQMKCTNCCGTLDFQNVLRETRYGFGSKLWINCECQTLNQVTTSKTHRTKARGSPVFDVNTKAAIGMLHSGSAHAQLRNFMATIEVPGLSFNGMKKREEEVSCHVSNVAQKSCTEALHQEITLQQKENLESAEGTPAACKVKYDMGWQKRGSGRRYDSKSGTGTMIGNASGKIVAYGVRSKDCRKCTYHLTKGQTPPEHDCVKNWNGSSKAMEPDVGASLVQEIESKNVRIDTLIMDDDCTTMAKIKSVVSHPITKWSDENHTKKKLGTYLYDLQNKHKQLNKDVIEWLQRCFSYTVRQNKNDVDGCAAGIANIVPHAFGNHDKCESWCGYHKDPTNYKHSSTSYGRDLHGEVLRNDLESVFLVFSRNADKIAPGGNTRDVESFNNMIATKAPKRHHYSASKSLQNRVECAVAQKNEGFGYVSDINVSLCLSPGKFYKQHADRKDCTSRKRLQYEQSRTFKKRRLEKKLKSKSNTFRKELREGTTYQSGIGMTHIADIPITQIPDPISPPVKETVSATSYQRVICDIETTSLHKNCDITQIAAVCGSDSFNCYILPKQPISHAASTVTGLTVDGNTLFYNGKAVKSTDLQDAVSSFLEWLNKQSPCILVGHNFTCFDCPRLLRAFEICGMITDLKQCVVGIADTLSLFKELYPQLQSYSQKNIVMSILQENYDAHNALEDVKSLQRLVVASNVANGILQKHSMTTESAIASFQHNKMTQYNLDTMIQLVEANALSSTMAKKVAGSGLLLAHLQLAIQRGGFDGLAQLFKEKTPSGKPRVTSLKRIIDSVFHFLNSPSTSN